MIYCSVNDVKALVKTISKASGIDIQRFIFDATSYVNSLLKNYDYLTPIQPSETILGDVSLVIDTSVVTGTNTQFTKYFYSGKYIALSNNETYLIKEVISDTELSIYDKALSTQNNVNFMYVPEDLAVITKFHAAKLILMCYFSEQAYNQDTRPFYNDYDIFVRPLLKLIQDGNFVDSTLKKQEIINKNTGVYQSLLQGNINRNSLRSIVDNHISNISSHLFK